MDTTLFPNRALANLPRAPPPGQPRRPGRRAPVAARSNQTTTSFDYATYFVFLFLPSVKGDFQMKMGLLLQVPPGTYHATFADVTKSSHEEYGPGVRWDFRLDNDNGDYSGVIVCRTTKDIASENNSCGKFLEMVSGMSLVDAVQYDTSEWLDVGGSVIVEKAPSGDGVRVAEFVRDPIE